MTANNDLIDQLANAIGSADIGAPWTVNDYPAACVTERYRKLARVAVAALPASIIEHAVGIIEEYAKGIKDSVTIGGKWVGEEKTKAEYDDMIETARSLRTLIPVRHKRGPAA